MLVSVRGDRVLQNTGVRHLKRLYIVTVPLLSQPIRAHGMRPIYGSCCNILRFLATEEVLNWMTPLDLLMLLHFSVSNLEIQSTLLNRTFS